MAAALQIASLFATIGADLRPLSKGLGEAQNKLQQAGSSMMGLGTKLTAGVTAPLVGLAGAAVKMAGDFEEQMGLMAIAARGAGAEFDTMREFALKMGADTLYNAREMADAMTGLFKAGMTAEEVMGDLTGETGALAAATQLATASDLELAQAADAIAVAMATFGLNAEDAIGITNNFVQAADASVAEVGGLVAALQNVGPTAAAFGWSMEDVNTALAILSERGIQGSEAGTALKSMMTNLMRPTDDVKETLQELGIALFDTEGSMKSLPQIISDLSGALYGQIAVTRRVGGRTKEQNAELERLQKVYKRTAQSIRDYEAGIKGATLSDEKRNKKLAELQVVLQNTEAALQPLVEIRGKAIAATKELTEAERLEAIQTLAGTYGMKAMNTLVGEGVEGWGDMEGAISTAATAQEIADIKTSSLSGILEELGGTLETVAINLGSLLLPFLKEFLTEHIIPLIGRIGELNPETVKMGLAIAGVAAAAGPVLMALGAIVTVVGALLSPIGLVVVALAGLGVAYATNFLGFKDAVDAILPKIIEFGQKAALWLGENIPIAMAAIKEFWDITLKPAIDEIILWLGENVPIAMEAISNFWNETLRPAIEEIALWLGENVPVAMQAISDFWYDTLEPALKSLWEWLDTYIVPALEAISLVMGELVRIGLQAFWAILTEKIIPALTDAWEWISEKLTPSAETMQGVMETLSGVLETVGGWMSSMAEEARALAEALKKVQPSEWFKGGSPSPFEVSLRGITDAALEATRAVQGLGGMPSGGFGGLTPAGAMAGAGGPPTIIVVNLDRRDFEDASGQLDYGAIGDAVMGRRLY